MKQRKKIKYVQKQPSGTLYQKPQAITTQTKQQNAQKYQARPQKNQPKEQTYLISSQQQPNYQKEEHKVRYVAKQTQQQPHHRQENKRDYYRNDAKLNAPRFVERQSSHHEMHCIICSEDIRRKDYIWTCSCCCISMHLKCIKQWIKSINQKQDKQALHLFNWKCPQCNFQYNQPMPKYYCFCGKHLNPQLDRDLPPHSCGQICNKKRGPYCTHPCPDTCHKGKCPTCEYQGMLVMCQCGKSQRMAKCSEERLAFQCGKKCEKILNCQKHKCEKNCHAGPCQPCKKKKMATCYCGKGSDVVDCSAGAYSCGEICQKTLNCGTHKCEQKCHNGQCNSCVRTPELQKTCPCGKYQIEMLTGDPEYRKSCQDSIPVCGMPCSRKLQCGHICPRSCHQGLCPACKVTVDQACVCGSQSRKIQCHKKAHNTFKCELVCKRKRSCGNHLCNQVCCQHRNSPILANHPCELNCTKMLNCRKHECGQTCHMGLCKKCPVVYSQPQPCPCGRSFLKPPIICGTLTPQCQNVCDRELSCGHKCKNICHYGACKCYEQVIVPCRCGKQQIKTTCGREALCLTKCQLILPCKHKCDLQCHKGTCLQAHKTHPCRKLCSQQRPDCKHICPQLCHPGQECQSLPCQAQILIKCQCGHRQTMTLCGAHDNHKTKKSIVCNKKCENKKRFDAFYQNKQIYYPGNMVQFAFKNYPYLQNLQARLQKFILHSDDNFIEVQYKFPDNHAKLLLTNLFENHYHLNTHFYRHGKYANFSLMQSQNTMIPKPVLSEYVKLISKGTIKQNNLPFEFTIGFEMEQKEKTDMIVKALRDYLHKYYTQRSGKHISLHFWSREDGQYALRFLENQYQTIEFKCAQNLTKPQEQITEEEILEIQAPNAVESQVKPTKQSIGLLPINQKTGDTQKQTSALVKVQQDNSPPAKIQQGKPKFIPEALVQKTSATQPKQSASKLIIRRGIPKFRKNDYPDSKENIQDIYQLDEQQIFGQKTNWPDYIKKLCSINMGPQAIQWRIRTLFIINSFCKVDEDVFHDQFSSLVKLYNKDKEAAIRILQIQRIDNKSVKKDMQQNGIYLSDHEPEMLSYLQIYNYLALEKILIQYPQILLKTREITKNLQIIEAVEKNDYKSFYHHFVSCDYVYSCCLIPIIHCLRESLLESLVKGSRFLVKDLHKFLLFNSKQAFEDYFLKNGIVVDTRVSKSTKEEIYFYKEGKLAKDLYKDQQFVKQLIFEKRDKKYFLTQAEEYYNQKYMTRSFFAFGDFKETLSPSYMNNLVKILKERQ